MSRVKDRTGQKFNKWTILTFTGLDKKGEAMWLCKCDCGTEKSLVIGNVVSGLSRQCLACSTIRNYVDNTLPPPVWTTMRKNALNRDYEFLITREFAEDLFVKQGKKCAISGIDIQFAKSNREYVNGGQTASLDRIDSSKKYTEDNVQWVHKHINLMKNVLSMEQLLNYCKLIVDHHNPKTN